MSHTRHMQRRMSQRGIKTELVELAMQLGYPRHDGKVVLNRKALLTFIDELTRLRSKALDAVKRGGLVVVAVDGRMITTYRMDSYQRGAGVVDSPIEDVTEAPDVRTIR